MQRTVKVNIRVLKRDVALVKSSALDARPAASLFNLFYGKKTMKDTLKNSRNMIKFTLPPPQFPKETMAQDVKD
jgi:hypothetical protein